MIKKRLFIACLLLGCLWGGRAQNIITDPIQLVCKLHGQTRRYQIAMREAGDTLHLQWKILRNGHWQEGSYTMLPEAVEAGSELAFLQPEDKQHVVLSANETFALLSRKAYRELKDKQACRYNGTEYRLADTHSQAMGRALLHAVDATEGCEIWVLDNPACPLVWKIQNNPLEINWQAESLAAASSLDLKEELTQTPEKTAGIYYAYPGPMDAVSTPAPEGYEPFYVSHYGRHGSRWITTDERYLAVIRVFDSCKEQSGLTPLGEDVRCRLQKVWEDARGRSGELTSVGVRQHRDIAERLYHRCLQVFADTSRIEARSSTAMRCAMSMTAFTERLKELNPSLCVTREAAPRYMDYIAYNSPEVKALSADTAFWRKDFRAFEDAHIHPDRLIASLFIRPNEVEDPRELMMGLYWIASDMQDVSLSLSFYDIFEPEELYGIWQCINYRMYVCNAAAPVGGGAGPRSAEAAEKVCPIFSL